LNKIQLLLTKLYIKLIGCSFKELREYTLPNDQKVELLVFKKDFIYSGQATPFRTIIVHENVFADSKKVQDFVVSHEFGHTRVPIALYWVILLIMALFFLSGVGLLIYSLKSSSIYHFILGVIFLLIIVMISWILEISAIFFAIKLLGEKRIKLALAEMRSKKKKRSTGQRIIYFMTHPPNKLTFYLFDKIYKSDFI